MPTPYTYPGVYVEEIPSGTRTIVGVSTSVTAFVGRAPMGPIGEPVRIGNFGAFERVFGGLNVDMPLTYSVRQYFRNGGADAVIVRLQREAQYARLFLPSGIVKEEKFDPKNQPETLSADDPKGAQIKLSADSIKQAVTLFIGPGQPAPMPYVPAGPGVLVGPTGTSFEKEVEITIPVVDAFEQQESATTPSAAPPEIQLLLWNHQNGSFRTVPVSIRDGMTVTYQTKTFDFDTVQPIVKTTGELPKVPLDALPLAYWVLRAKSPGTWGNGLQAFVDYDTRARHTSLFNLTIELRDPATASLIATERFLNLSIDSADPSYATRTLAESSSYVEVISRPPARPQANRASWLYVADGAGGDGLPLNAKTLVGNQVDKSGIYALEDTDIFNLLVIPPLERYAKADGDLEGLAASDPDVPLDVWDEASGYCALRRALLLVDPPEGWQTTAQAEAGMANLKTRLVTPSANSAIFWPFLRAPDPLRDNLLAQFAPSGAVAGLIARTDGQVGVWKAVAGQAATLATAGLSYVLNDNEIGRLNPLGLNCLRPLPIVGPVVWGARTSVGADRLASEWKYAPVRRTALFIEESLFRGLQWVVFEPNDEPLWAQIRLNVGAFMQGLFLAGAFQGSLPNQAYFVRCDAETNPQINVERGIVTVVVGFAPLKPAEFVVVQVQQLAGQTA